MPPSWLPETSAYPRRSGRLMAPLNTAADLCCVSSSFPSCQRISHWRKSMFTPTLALQQTGLSAPTRIPASVPQGRECVIAWSRSTQSNSSSYKSSQGWSSFVEPANSALPLGLIQLGNQKAKISENILCRSFLIHISNSKPTAKLKKVLFFSPWPSKAQHWTSLCGAL